MQAYDRWHPKFQAESTGLENTLFQMLVREGVPVKDLLSTGGDLDKVTRARSAAVRIESGSIYSKKDAHWLPEYEDELVAFDKGTHNDQMDVASYAARCLVEKFVDDEYEPFIIGI